MAHKHDPEKYRDVPVMPVNYPGQGSPHIAHLFGTTDGFPQHVSRPHDTVSNASERHGCEDPAEHRAEGGEASEKLKHGS